MRIFFLIISLLFCQSAFPNKLEKGFERLAIHDYFLAKEYFEKELKKETPAAAYGLSRIYSFFKNPFYSPDSARRYILVADSTFKRSKERKKRYYAELGVTDSSIAALSSFICDDAFKIAEEADSVEAYDHFMKYYNTCEQFTDAISLRNAAAFNRARKVNTSAAYKEFIARYPQSEQFAEAHSKYDEQIYLENTSEKSVESYAYFLQNFPESPYKGQAEKMIYSLSTPDKSIRQYVAFAREYKDSKYAGDAWHEVYKLSMKDFSEASFNKFKSTYPDYPFPEELEADFQLQNYFFLPFQQDEQWGYINELGVVMIAPQYEEASLFSEGLASVADENLYGYIDKAGKKIIPASFADAESFHNGLAVVLKDSLYGIINKRGEFVIEPAYEEISEAGEDVFMCVKDDLSGYVKEDGTPLTPFQFDVTGEFKDGYAIVSKDEKYGLIGMGGYFNIEPKYDEIVFIGNELVKASDEEEYWGILNVQGQTVLPFEYDVIGEFSENRALVSKDDKCGFVNGRGEIVIPLTFRYVPIMLSTSKFRDGYALLRQKFKSIIIDTTGKVISFPGCADYGMPSGGLMPVKKNRKWGYMDMTGKLRIPCKYENVEPIQYGLGVIELHKMKGLVDSLGNVLIEPLYEDIIVLPNVLQVRYNGRWGLLSRSGNMLLSCNYERIEMLSDDIARAIDANGYTYVNAALGKIIHSPLPE